MMRLTAGLLLVFLSVACIGASSFALTREPAVSGTFYPADSTELAGMVRNQLDNVTGLPEINGRIMAILVPHAGLVYSGQIAAYGYKILENRGINNAILCGPSHRYRFDGLSVYGPFVKWRIPLGLVPCQNEMCDRLVSYDKRIEIIRQAHAQEHCLEVQLPYLQTVADSLTIVPVIMGSQDKSTIDLLADALAELSFDEHTIMVASTDWQHYRPASAGWPMDSLGLDCLREFDPDRLERYLAQGRVEMCGGGVAVAVLKAAARLGADRIKILKYGDSGDATGDKSSVVSYTAAVIYKSAEETDKKGGYEKPADKIEEKLPEKFELTADDKGQLLKIARESIKAYLEEGRVPEFAVSDNLEKFGAAFVTLQKQGALRGCIGHTSAIEPLYKSVAGCAVQAAVADPRFPPVNSSELDDIDIEISVLTPMQKVNSLDEIMVGRDGLMIFKGPYRGLLLPQVATDYGWDRTEFIEQTCRKAGLTADAYKSPEAVLYKFQVVLFGE